jgi:RimJ/RimL family protein N-acetyltransferase
VPDGTTLRPFREDDLPLLDVLFNDPAGSEPYSWYGWIDPHQLRRQWHEGKFIEEHGGRLVVDHGGERVGVVSWFRQRLRQSQYWNIGISLLPEARGHGYGAEAQRLLVEYLFRHTTAHRIEAETETGNVAEQRALEKAGFTREGVLRGVGFRGGHYRDMVMYSVLRAEVHIPD